MACSSRSPSACSVVCWLRSGSCSSMALRARCNALFTEATVVSSGLGDLARRESEHLAHDQRRALPRREQLERRHEGQLDALALLVARRRRREAVHEPELGVRVRLDPDRLREGGSWRCADRSAARTRAAGPARAAARWRSGRRSSRCGTARRAASCAPRMPRRPRQARSSASCSASSASCTDPSMR